MCNTNGNYGGVKSRDYNGKIFPANIYGGLNALKALSAPFPQIKFIPTGGINKENMEEYLAYDRVVAVGGSFFVEEALRK